MGFSFYTLYSGGSWYDTLGARGFFPVVCGEAAIVTSAKKDPLLTIAASSLNFRRKQQGKKPFGTQGTGTSAE